MNAQAYPWSTGSIAARSRLAAALLTCCASQSMRMFAVALALVTGGLGWLAAATIDKPERLSVALFLTGLAVAAVWGMWFARLLLLHLEAHQSRMPGVAKAIGGTVVLVFVASVVLPSLLLVSAAVDPVLAVSATTLAACGGVLAATLPRIAYIALCLAPLGFGLLHAVFERVVPAGAVALPTLQLHQLAWLVPPALALAAWRWLSIVRRPPDDAKSVWWQPALVANPRTGGGFNWMTGDAANAQLPDWMWPAGQTTGADPSRPVRAIRALMGTPFAPLSASQILVQLGVGVLAIVYLLMGPSVGDGHSITLVGGAIGGTSVMVVMYAQRLEALYTKAGGEIEELALLPGLGDMPARRTVLLMAVGRAPAIAMIIVLAILLGVGLFTALSPRMMALVLMAGVGTALVTGVACLRPLAGLRMNGWRMLVLAGPVLLLALGTVVYATQAKDPGQATQVIALAWGLVYALLAVAAVPVWRRLQARPHPFLMN